MVTNNHALKETQRRLDQYLVTAKFALWRALYVSRQSKVALRTLAIRLPIIYARKKARRKLSQLRVCREWVMAKEKGRGFQEYNHSFYRWRLLTSTLRIQRHTRIFLAKSALFRKVNQKRRIVAHDVKRKYESKLLHLANWRHFQKRRKFRRRTARNTIVRFLNKYVFLHRLSKVLLKQKNMRNFLYLIDLKHKKKSFGQLHRMVFGLKKFMCLKRMCAILNHLILADTFKIFQTNTRDQHRINGLVKSLIDTPLNRMMSRVSAEEQWVYQSKEGYHAGVINIVNCSASSLSAPDVSVDIRNWPTLLNTAGTHVRMDSSLYDKKKIFQSWLFAFRLRTMRKVEHCAKNSPPIFDTALKTFRVKQNIAITIQKWVRGYQGMKKSRDKRLAMLVFWENATILRQVTQHRFQRRNFSEMVFLILHSKTARLRLQCWFRQCLARMKRTQKKINLSIQQQKEYAVYRLHRRNDLSKIMRLMEFGCVLRCCAIQLASPRERHQQNGGTLKPMLSLENKQLRTRMMKKKPLAMTDFSSEEYHNHLFRLKQTGVLVVDSAAVVVLRPNELAFLIESATTLFSQAAGEHQTVRDIATNFHGNKLIFCGGMISESTAHDLYYLLTSREEKIAINFSEVTVCFKAVSKIARSLEHNFAKIRELSVDSDSMGSLGIAALLVSLKVYQSICCVCDSM